MVIVPVHDVGETDVGDLFIVSKLIDGSDLETRMKLDRPDRILSLRIIEQMADALIRMSFQVFPRDLGEETRVH